MPARFPDDLAPGPAVTAVERWEDERIAPYRAVRDRDLVRDDGLFIVEGAVPLRALLSEGSRFRARSALLSPVRAAELAPGLLDRGVPVYVAERAVMDRIVGFPIHRGVLACAGREPDPALAGLLAATSLAVGLIGLANHDNVGGVFRNAAAFGAGAVLVDEGTCDPLYRKAIRVSAGACLTVPFARAGSPAEAVRRLVEAGFEPLALTPGGGEPLHALAWPDRAALLLGAEGPGLPDDVLARCRRVRIEMAAGTDSLNVATASGVALAAAYAARLGRVGEGTVD